MLGSLGGVCVYPGMPTCDIPLSTSVQAALILSFNLEREEGAVEVEEGGRQAKHPSPPPLLY